MLDRRRTLNGLYHCKEHKAWGNMLDRCYNVRHTSYENYGGRGITVCANWLEGFLNFYEDMGPCPEDKDVLDRFPNNNGNYEPGNVRWATYEESNRNKRDNVLLAIGGETCCLAEWAERTNLPYHTFQNRLGKGWPVEDLLHPLGTRLSLVAIEVEKYDPKDLPKLCCQDGTELRQVPGWESYFVSDKGDIWSTRQKGKYITPTGALYVRLTKPKSSERWETRVPILVARCWIGPPPFAGAEVWHRDENPNNNFYENLEYENYCQ